MIKINLLAEGKRPTAVRKSKSAELLKGQDIGQWLLAAGFFVGVLVAAYFWWMTTQEKAEQDEMIATAQAEVAALDSVIKEVEDYKAKKTALETKIKVINDLKLNQRGPVRVMDYISKALPELLWIDRMTMDDAMITVEGRAFNTNAVANFIEKLDEVPEFEEPTLKDTTEQAGGVYKFSIEFKYSFALPAPPAGAEGDAAAAPGAATPAPAPAPTAG
jgi:type IV pilus assembly protein PilN